MSPKKKRIVEPYQKVSLDSKQRSELRKAAAECGRTATNVLAIWAVSLAMVWASYIWPQFLQLQTISSVNALFTSGRFDGPQAKERAEELNELVQSLRPAEKILEPRQPTNLGELAAADRRDVFSLVVNQVVELPLGIKFESRATLVPALWCLAVLGLVIYLLIARSRCHRLIARALAQPSESPIESEVSDHSLLYSQAWWVAPLPSGDGEAVSAARFRSAVEWSLGDRFAPWLRRSAILVFAAAYSTAVAVSWQSSVLIEGEEATGSNVRLDATGLLGVSLHDIEWFVVREASSLAIVLGCFAVFAWFRRRRVPDYSTRSKLSRPRRHVLVFLGVAAGAVVVTPLANLVRARPRPFVRTPRFVTPMKKSNRRNSRRPHPGAGREADITRRLRQGLNGKVAVQEVREAIALDRDNFRLYDFAAALCVQKGLTNELRELADAANNYIKPMQRQRSDDEPESLPRNNGSGSSNSKFRRRPVNVLRAMLRGHRIRPQTPEPSGRRCVKGQWSPRVRGRRPSSTEELSRRVAAWTSPQSSWRRAWSKGGARAKRGWKLPGEGSTDVVCS